MKEAEPETCFALLLVRRRQAVVTDKDVGRLQVAMDDAVLVGVVDGAGDRFEESGRLARRLRLAHQLRPQRSAFDQLQRQIGFAVVFDDFVNLHDVGMRQARQRLGLDPRARHLAIAAGAEAFQGDEPIEPQLASFVDDAHAAAPKARRRFHSPAVAASAPGPSSRGHVPC